MNKKWKAWKQTAASLAPFIAPYKGSFFTALLMVALTNFCLAFSPQIEGMITTQLANDVMAHTAVDLQAVLRFMVILLGIYLTKTVSQIVCVFLLTNSIQNAMHDLRNTLQNKIRRLPVRYFDTNQFGDVLSRLTNDIDTISNALQQTLTQVLSGILSVSLALVMMMRINVMMAFVAIMIIPLMLLITRFIVKRSQKRFSAQQKALGKLNGTITEMYTGFNEILLYNKQEASIQQFRKINEELCGNAFLAQFMSSIISPIVSLVTYLTLGTIAVMGTMFAIQGIIQVGELQAFVRYIWQVNDPLSRISNLSAQIQSAFAAMGRVFEVLNEEEEIKESSRITDTSAIRGSVTFDHVNFGYHEETVIHDFSVHVKPGQMVAIVGPTGAGKTTLINLLMRFYDVKSGCIAIDGVDIRDMKRDDLRSIFGMVLQDTWLFSGTIYDNIRYGRLDARKDEVIEAAKQANVHHFIRTLPDGYNSMLNEEANNISQGEKQLLTIARAMLKDPRILILDEATSSVDTRLEKMLQDAMHTVMQGRTSFVIAHRLSTIRSADLILVIKDGNIVEQGTHEELMKKKGFYEQLYQAQFADMH